MWSVPRFDWFQCGLDIVDGYFDDFNIFIGYFKSVFPDHQIGENKYYRSVISGFGCSFAYGLRESFPNNPPLQLNFTGEFFKSPYNHHLHSFLDLFYKLGFGINLQRVDVCVDLHQSCSPDFTCHYKSMSPQKFTTWYQGVPTYTGFAIGKTDRRWKVYNKFVEQALKGNVVSGEWWRYEHTVRGKVLKAQFDKGFNQYTIEEILIKVCGLAAEKKVVDVDCGFQEKIGQFIRKNAVVRKKASPESTLFWADRIFEVARKKAVNAILRIQKETGGVDGGLVYEISDDDINLLFSDSENNDINEKKR